MSTTPTLTKAEIIKKNWDIYCAQLRKLEQKNAVNSIISSIEEAAILAPASTKYEFVCSYEGGLVEHSLRVLHNMAKLWNIYDIKSVVTKESILTTALLHDIGKIGTIGLSKKDYYLDVQDDWKRNKLQLNYELNPALKEIPVSSLSLKICADSGFHLTLDEWTSISSIRNKNHETPEFGESWLNVILQQAIKASCLQGKNKKTPELIG